MKVFFIVIISFIFINNASAQILIRENTSVYLGPSSLLFENTKTDAGYLYNIILNDSVKAGDTIFRNSSGKPVSMIIQTNLKGMLRWHICLSGFFSEKPFKIKDKVAQIIHFTDSVYKAGNEIIQNPENEKCYGLASIDTSAKNISLIKIGNEIKSSGVSKLQINCLSYNNSGNIIVSGYQTGTVNIGGQTFYSDSIVSTYFAAEISTNGTLINYKTLFYTESVYLLSRGIEYKDQLIFETGFDSISISGKAYSAPVILNQRLNDVALIIFNKNTLELKSHAVLTDSSSNIYVPANDMVCNSNGILWPVKSSTGNFKVNDSLITLSGKHEQLYILLDLQTASYKSHYFISTDLNGSYDIHEFDSNSFVMTFRYAGSFVKINGETIALPTDIGTTAFVVLGYSLAPKLVFTVKGASNAVRLTAYTEKKMEIWVNYFAPGSNLTAKSETLVRKTDHLHWKYQITHYSFENFSGMQPRHTNHFDIYPNPCTDIIHLLYPESGLTTIRLYNSTGQLLAEHFNTHLMDVTGHPNGLYFVELISDKQSQGVKKILIIR